MEKNNSQLLNEENSNIFQDNASLISSSKLTQRRVQLTRTADNLRKVAAKLRRDGNDEQALTLEQRADAFDELAEFELPKDLDNKEPNENIDSSKNTKEEVDKETANTQTQNEDSLENKSSSDESAKEDSDNKTNDQTQSENSLKDSTSSNEESKKDASKDQNDNASSNEDSKDETSKDQNEENSNKEQNSDQSQSKNSVLNPFEIDPNKVASRNQTKSMQQKPTLDDMLEILKKLPEDAKAGAIASLNDILNKKAKGLSEAFIPLSNKKINEYSDDEFARLIDNAVSEINSITKIKIYSSDENDTRISKINAEVDHTKKEMDQEDKLNAQNEYQKVLANEKEKRKYDSLNLKGVDRFEINFQNSILDQIEKYKTSIRTYRAIDIRTEDDPTMVSKGEASVEDASPIKPIINLYFDQSGSWTDDVEATNFGKKIVTKLIDYENQNLIDLNICYFSDSTITSNIDDSHLGQGTLSWKAIINNIIATKANNVVLLTDYDMQWQAKNARKLTIPGEVWIIWRHGARANAIPEALQGKRGTHEYKF